MIEKPPLLEGDNNRKSVAFSAIISSDEDLVRHASSEMQKIFETDISIYSLEHPESLVDEVRILDGILAIFLGRYNFPISGFDISRLVRPDFVKISEKEKQSLLEKSEKGTTGYFSPIGQYIVVFEEYSEENKVAFYQTLLHEVMHYNSFNSFQTKKETDSSLIFESELEDGSIETSGLIERRSGFETLDESRFFLGINEAVIEELAIRLEEEYFNAINDMTSKEKNRYDSMRKSNSSKKFSEQYFWRKEDIEILEDGNFRVTYYDYAYEAERKYLRSLIQELYNKNTNIFSSEEEIFDMFVSATMGGNILPVARLIEETLGKGVFRRIGKETSEGSKYS